MLQKAAKNAYSWWWASHVRTKQSKWLDQNLQDMEEKVEYILQIIDEDGDTFRQRAEMYYQKRPEIINFVEDSFRGYRALAERYDHLSRELQSANRTIAAVYPERFQLGMDDIDDFDPENLPTTKLPSDELKNLSKNPPVAPKFPIPKIPGSAKKNAKMPSRLMSKKGLLKINAAEAVVAAPNSGLSKSEALQRIDKLQKEILALQTEKEFVKSSYESGLEKYWDIEKQVTEMQVEVDNLEDEFGIGTVIEDDEARSLMTGAALKSCQEALTLLQQKQEQSTEDARVELERIQEAREKFKTLKKKITGNQAHLCLHFEENTSLSLNMESNKLEQEVDNAEPNIQDLETLRKKFKEELQAELGTSLTMSELAEKVDELVDKVINLESAVSSQSANVKRLRSEANELHTHIQSLEEEKETLIEDPYGMRNRVRELEEELQTAQSLSRRVKEQNNQLQTHYIEASFNLVDLSKKFLNVKPDEKAASITLSSQVTDVLGANTFNQIQLHEMEPRNNVPEICEDVNSKEVVPEAEMLEQNACNAEKLNNPVQTSSSSHVACHLQDGKMMSSSDTNEVLGIPAMEMKITPGCSSVASESKTVFKEAEEDGIIDHSKSSRAKSEKFELSNQKKSQLNFRSGALLDMESEDETVTENGSTVVNSMVFQEEAKEHNVWNSDNSEEQNDKSLFQPRQQHDIDYFPENQEGSTRDENPQKWSSGSNNTSAPGYDIQIVENATIEDKGTKADLPKHNTTSKFGEGNVILCNEDNLPERRLKEQDEFILSNRDNHTDAHSIKGQVSNLPDANPEKSDVSTDSVVQEEIMEMNCEEKKGEMFSHSTTTLVEKYNSRYQIEQSGDDLDNRPMEGPCNDLITEKVMKLEAMKEDFSLPNRHNHSDDCSFNGHVGDLPDSNSVKLDERRDSLVLAETMERKGVLLAAENRCRSQRLQYGDESRQTDAEMVENMNQDCIPYQGKDHEAKKQNVLHAPERNLDTHLDELGVEEDDRPNWKELFMSGLDDREKILLKEYTSILRNYKEVRKKLNEVEKKKRASLFQYCIQIKVLRSANAMKDAKIQSLEKSLNFLQGNQDGTPESKERETKASLHASDDQSYNTGQVTLEDLLQKETFESTDTTEESNTLLQPKNPNVEEDGGDESPKFSIIEEKIRTDIDELQEENIEFWMKFSNSFHKIPKFQDTIEDLQAEIAKLKEVKQQDRSANPRSHSSDIRPIYRHLREIHTELILWLDHNAVLNDDLHNRLSSLSSVEEEITKFSNAGLKVEENELSDCQAAKFQGEVLNMKHENEKVADELQSGVERVRILQAEIERTLRELDDEFDISVKNQKSRYTAVRSRIPLRSFLFGVKLKKQRPPSFLACMSPALQKQHSDLGSLQR